MNAITFEQAEAAAYERLSKIFGAEVRDLLVQSRNLVGVGWLFTYNSKSFVETGDPDEALLGNAPIIVDHSGGIHEPRSGDDLDEFLEKLRAHLTADRENG